MYLHIHTTVSNLHYNDIFRPRSCHHYQFTTIWYPYFLKRGLWLTICFVWYVSIFFWIFWQPLQKNLCIQDFKECPYRWFSDGISKYMKHMTCYKFEYKDSPDSTVFVPPGNSTIAKTVLIGDWFITKIAIYDFWIFKVPFFPSIEHK